MDVNTLKSVYFIGAGGIGMSALVRYFLSKGKKVGGYDRTPSELTEKLIEEGAAIHYEESTELITDAFRDPATTLVVYTPAVPDTHKEFTYFRENGFEIHKRSQVLGMLTHAGKGLCVAGTHGKTTTSTMTAHLLHQSHVGCNAFLGGISKNYGTNLLLSDSSEYMVIEADEFDRSFHWLSPYISVITATRQKIGGSHASISFVKQFPVLTPEQVSSSGYEQDIVERVARLCWFNHDLDGWMEELREECPEEYDLPEEPVIWDEEQRTVWQAELDAIFAHLYGLTTEDLRYILDPEDVCGKGCINETFRVLKERELRELGEYRTKRLVMEAWNKFEFDNKLKMLCYEK